MSDIAIGVEGLSKRYRIGALKNDHDTLRDQLAHMFGKPMRWLRHKSNPEVDNPYSPVIWALKDASFSVNRGEVVGIIGHNGAGKSTLLKILSRVTSPTEGKAEVYGHVGSLLEVGTGFHPELTGRENTYLNGAIMGMKKRDIDRKFEEIAAFAEIEKFVDTPVKRYSSGMYVRLAFAVAAYLEPEILLVDEVLAVGDASFQKKCLGKIGDVAGEGRTVLFVSHNMSSVASLCPRSILVDGGRLVADGQTDRIIRQYLGEGDTATGEKIWTDLLSAPGNDVVRLRAVRVRQHGVNGPAVHVDVSKEVVIEIEFWNLEDGAQLYTGIVLMSTMGVAVLQSLNSPSLSLQADEWYGRPRPRGLFRSTCRIPAHLLNQGQYSVTALLGKVPVSQMVHESGVVSFHTIVPDDPDHKYYAGALIRPRLAWGTDYLTDTNPSLSPLE